jgi:spore coat polysaccharide biosynthesis protein SpsF
MNKVLAIIQARVGSSRLPGKTLLDISGKPMLWHVINRLGYTNRIDDIVVAIPDSTVNDHLEDFLVRLGVKSFRGSENDVLTRYYQAALANYGEIIVRITSDCPLIDPKIVDSAIKTHLDSDNDYTCVGNGGGFPRGLDTEVFNVEALLRANLEARQQYEREHVTPYFYEHPSLFKINAIMSEPILNRPNIRLTVDTKEDLELVRLIFKYLGRNKTIFYSQEIIELIDEHPEFRLINANIKQKLLGNS